MTFYRCTRCDWLTETPDPATSCSRCKSDDIHPLTADDIAAMLDTGEAAYCEPCQRIHSGPLTKEKSA